MSTIDDLLPKAADCKKKVAEIEGEKASQWMLEQSAKAAEKKALMDELSKPSGVSDEERMKRATVIIKRAVEKGLIEIEAFRFPNQLCTDGGRAINQQEPGWENTLTGLPKELYQFWKRYLQPRGYKLKCQIVDWPDGKPGDVGMTVSWG
jgi:hypothetical protein